MREINYDDKYYGHLLWEQDRQTVKGLSENALQKAIVKLRTHLIDAADNPA